MTTETAQLYVLPARHPPGSPDQLLAFLLEHRAHPVKVSLREVRRLDSRALETLLVAARDWATRDLDFSLCEVSESLSETLALLGVTPDMITWSDAA